LTGNVDVQQIFEIHPSRSQPGLMFGAHALVAMAILVYVEPTWLMLTGLALVGLLAQREVSQLQRFGTVTLKLDPGAGSIELEQGGQPHIYFKYKVYATRWFAILKLVDKQKNRTLILNPDRFDSIQSYRQLRFALCNLEQHSAD